MRRYSQAAMHMSSGYTGHFAARSYADALSSLFAQVLGSGMHLGFHCVVFELCQATLFDVLQGYSGLAPLPMRHIIEIAYQIIKAIGRTFIARVLLSYADRFIRPTLPRHRAY